MFISNHRATFHLWRKEHLLRHQKVLNYYENDCLQNFLLLFVSLLTGLYKQLEMLSIQKIGLNEQIVKVLTK